MEDLKHKKCTMCEQAFSYKQEETWWDYSGMNNVKLVKCPHCGTNQSLKYEEQKNPNYDRRYYYYN